MFDCRRFLFQSRSHTQTKTGNPKPNVIWFRKQRLYEEIVDDSYESYTLENSTINGIVRMAVVNVLNLRRLDRNDYMASYLCRASTRFYYRPLIASITIDMNCNNKRR